MKNKLNNTIYTKGFTLLEIMVAMVIFAVGLLGLAGMQSLAFQNTHSSYSRSQAILLAYEMADRIKANALGSVNYTLSVTATSVTGYTGSTMCTANRCTITDIVKYDMGLWQAAVTERLPGGQSSIAIPSAKNHLITVHWDEDRTGVTGTNCSSSTPGSSSDLRCFQLTLEL